MRKRLGSSILLCGALAACTSSKAPTAGTASTVTDAAASVAPTATTDAATVQPVAPTASASVAPTTSASAAPTASASAAPTASAAAESRACAACNAKPHRMCSEHTDGECIEVCLVGWAKVGMTHCGKICKSNADCRPNKGTCRANMAENEGVKLCDAEWMGILTHRPQ